MTSTASSIAVRTVSTNKDFMQMYVGVHIKTKTHNLKLDSQINPTVNVIYLSLLCR